MKPTHFLILMISTLPLNLGYNAGSSVGEIHEIDLTDVPPQRNLAKFVYGTARNPVGVEIAADGVSLLENGRRITPVMGEFHYARYPRAEWRDELLKMKAGGINIVATYVFWIHHQEVEDRWDWSGDRDLRAFVSLCGELGLRCVVRCGPWCHGEVRNGGLPDWLIRQNIKLRSNDPAYLEKVERLYRAIAEQLRGLLWKDGGPVIGVQIENEFRGDPQHMLKLKQIVVDAGLDVPLYTRTGWPEMRKPLPFGAFLPLYGGYAEGFWDRELSTMPGRYWKEFVFKRVRTDAAIATDHFGSREAADTPDATRYPYLTCEIGPGMMSSYHRRINIFPMDALSLVIVKLGSGSNSPGYYMYHGGTNPVGREPWLQENQRTLYTNYNDMPVKTYDFQTALGEFGQVREQYHLLRLVHLFLEDFGESLAPMTVVLPDEEVKNKEDQSTFRWSVRTDGHSGFVFVNNYQRLLPMPAQPSTQLRLNLERDTLAFPRTATTVAADRAFFWPFNFDLGEGITLLYATAQVVCQVRDGTTAYTIFANTGNPAEFAFSGEVSAAPATAVKGNERLVLEDVTAGTTPIAKLTAKNGTTHQIFLLDEQTAQQCYKGKVGGIETLVLTSADVIFDHDALRLTCDGASGVSLSLLPAPVSLHLGDDKLEGVADGAFTTYRLPARERAAVSATAQLVREAGELRTIPIGVAGVAEAPTDADFEQAAVWKIKLPEALDPSRKLLLRVDYVGDVARAYLGDRLLTDNFYNGTPFEIGLNRYNLAATDGELTLKVLPLQAGAPIYMHPSVRPRFKSNENSLASLNSVEVIESHEVRVSTHEEIP